MRNRPEDPEVREVEFSYNGGSVEYSVVSPSSDIQDPPKGFKNSGSVNMSESPTQSIRASSHSNLPSPPSSPLLYAGPQLNAPDIPVSIPLGESGSSPPSGAVSSHGGSSHPYNDSIDLHCSTTLEQTELELSVDDPPNLIECPDSPVPEMHLEPNDSILENQESAQAISSVLESLSPAQEPKHEAHDAAEIQSNTESPTSLPEDTTDKQSGLQDRELSSDPTSILESPLPSTNESTHDTVTPKLHGRHLSLGSLPQPKLTSPTPDSTTQNEESPAVTPRRRFVLANSAAQEEWETQKKSEKTEGEDEGENEGDGEGENEGEGEGEGGSESIDKLMALVGLEAVKAQFLAIKAKIDTFKDQEINLQAERFNVIFQGSPGTGKYSVNSELYVVQ